MAVDNETVIGSIEPLSLCDNVNEPLTEPTAAGNACELHKTLSFQYLLAPAISKDVGPVSKSEPSLLVP